MDLFGQWNETGTKQKRKRADMLCVNDMYECYAQASRRYANLSGCKYDALCNVCYAGRSADTGRVCRTEEDFWVCRTEEGDYVLYNGNNLVAMLRDNNRAENR